YLEGPILPGERKSVEPMAARVAPGDTQQLHPFVSTSPWATAPLEDELVRAADRLVGGPDAVLVVDDTALVKQGRRSVGVKRQYCGQLGRRADCQAPVSLTLAGAGGAVGVDSGWAAGRVRDAVGGAPDRRWGGPAGVLVVDATALVKQGGRSVGVKRQYCGQLGRRANCQPLVSLTLAGAEVPVGETSDWQFARLPS